jgi:hypothetical protein
MASSVETRSTSSTGTRLRRAAQAGYRQLLLAFLVLGAFRSRPGARLVIASVVLFLLVALVQSLLAGLADDTVWFGGLHALDGLAILGIATFLYLAARRRHS